MPKNSYKLVTELSRSQRFRRFKSTCIENNSNISCIASSSNSHITNSNLTNTSQDTSKSIPITSNSINHSSGDEFNDDKCFDHQNKLCDELRKWVSNKCISASAVTSLLKILCSCNPSDLLTFPKDVRTLMSTPRLALVTKKVGDNGEYAHFGLESGLRNKWLKYNDPFVIGSYYGTKEPKDIEAYLEDFINEATHLTKNGYICDAPARALVKVIKRHNGYFGCEKCEVEGNYINNRMSFAEISAPYRTNHRLAAASYDDHCLGKSPLVKIPETKLVTNFPLDCLHLIYLGAVLLLVLYGEEFLRIVKSTQPLAQLRNREVENSKIVQCLPNTIGFPMLGKMINDGPFIHGVVGDSFKSWFIRTYIIIMGSKKYVICE
ncbi:Uncharacterized protein FWK35_00015285 [Aphis craccivora]|uniref:Uncharacterized protein n=1 Tax=Aphis craccivora TaxID=307492 RepID=A0A6G0Y117_APHCR|nr:Uncharacterized protein FWK35_00015285 [Aphis craccivora]